MLIQGLIMLPVKMNENEITELCRRYGHPTMKGEVKWKMFVDDIDQGIVKFWEYIVTVMQQFSAVNSYPL